MSITYSIDHTPTTVEDVSVEVAPKSEMTLQQTSVDSKTGEVSVTYVLASGDISYPATVTFRSSLQNRANGAKRRISMTFNTWAVSSDSTSGIDTRENISVTTSILVPAGMTLETADVNVLLGNAFSYMYPSVTTKLRSTAWLQKLLYGVPQVV